MPARRRLLRVLSASAIGLIVALWATFLYWGGSPVDALCYWLTDPSAPYRPEPYQFTYTPAAAQAIAPALALPFEWFTALIRAAELGSLYALLGPFSILAAFLPPVAAEINAANINLVLGFAIVLSFRWPALWALPLLTKPTMGMGLVWFAVRREWRALLIALGVTGGIVVVSWLYAPRLWADYVVFLATGTPHVGDWPFPYPVWLRLPLSLALVVWGARTNRRWTVVAAAALALPRLYFLSPALLLAMVPLVEWRELGLRARRRVDTSVYSTWLRRRPRDQVLPSA